MPEAVVEEPNRLTPYQGRRRCFGLYQCPKCERQWSSGNSWANTTQKCRGCDTKVYAKVQRPLRRRRRRSRRNDPTKRHPEELCGKCTTLGHSCLILPK